MSKKIPCGGFYLDDMLSVDENGKLGVNGGEPYKQLVTDGDGNPKWEDRLAYDDSRTVVNIFETLNTVKVSDNIPAWVADKPAINVWMSDLDGSKQFNINSYSENLYFVMSVVVFVLQDGADMNGLVFPEKGVYFFTDGRTFTTGISIATSDKPEITWDGNIDIIKKIDKEYMPDDMDSIIIKSSTSGSKKKFKITVDDSGTISATEVTT